MRICVYVWEENETGSITSKSVPLPIEVKDWPLSKIKNVTEKAAEDAADQFRKYIDKVCV